MRVDLIGGQDKVLSVAVNNQESINCFVMKSPRGRNEIVLVGSPGTLAFGLTSGTMRGCKECAGVGYWVIDNSLYSVAADGTYTEVGSVPGAGRVSMAADRTTVIIVNGTATGCFYNVQTGVLSTVTMPWAATTVDLSNGHAVFSDSDQRFFISRVNDVDSFDALDFAQANKSPDDVIAVIEDHGEILLFGAKTTEPWLYTADVDFPFAQNAPGIFERGLYARFSLVKDDNTVFFLGDDLIVYRLNGYTPIRVSDDGIESIISKIYWDGGHEALREAFAFCYTDHGHKFYQLTIPEHVTLVFDVATGLWHRKKHWDYETHHAVCYMECYGKHLIGGIDGRVYEMSRNYYQDNFKPLKRVRRSSVFSMEDRLLKWKELKFIFEFGTTPVTIGQGTDPVVVVRFSNDNGLTFGNEKVLPLGAAGDYTAKAIKRHCGASRARTIEFYVTDPVPFSCLDAYAILS